MHLIVLIQESLPSHKASGHIGDFIRKISQKVYRAPFVEESWSKIRPREIRIFDFTIPEAAEEEVLTDLAPYTCGKLQKLSKITNIPILKDIIRNKLGIKPVNMDDYRARIILPENRKVQEVPIYMSILGKIEDDHNEEGIEML